MAEDLVYSVTSSYWAISLAACVTFIFGSLRVNSAGVNIVLLIGAAK